METTEVTAESALQTPGIGEANPTFPTGKHDVTLRSETKSLKGCSINQAALFLFRFLIGFSFNDEGAWRATFQGIKYSDGKKKTKTSSVKQKE